MCWGRTREDGKVDNPARNDVPAVPQYLTEGAAGMDLEPFLRCFRHGMDNFACTKGNLCVLGVGTTG